MIKERMLTVLVPINDGDVTQIFQSLAALLANVAPGPDNINNIYAVGFPIFGYVRAWLNPATNQYEFHQVEDREFPYLGKPLEIFDFTYDATRMGSAPTISAQGVMWFADKDEDNNDVTLEDLWLARCNDCHVSFNGENLYLKQVPTCSKDNEDARYKYDIDFVSERVVLERVYLYDVVQPFVTERPISESSSFSFFGDVSELAKRINASMIRSGISSLVRKVEYYNTEHYSHGGVPVEIPYLTYEQWNLISTNPSMLVVDGVFEGEGELMCFGDDIYRALNGDYNSYLMLYIYENTDGEFEMSGYKCVIGKDKYGEKTSSEEKLVSFENNTIHEALQQVDDIYELQYYIYSERDSNGNFTGNTVIMIADCEHDFADIDGDDYVRDVDGIPTTEHPFDYGVDNELLSKEKTNTTDKIVTRITGVGSSENIPWYYPNHTADGWIKPVYKTNGEVQAVGVLYPQTEGDTDPEHVYYEKYLKNRIGDVFNYGNPILIKNNTDYVESASGFSESENSIVLRYNLSTITNAINPKLLIGFALVDGSNTGRVTAQLYNLTTGTIVDSYDSSQTYVSPTQFQLAMVSGEEDVPVDLVQGNKYQFIITVYRENGAEWPLSQNFDYRGYHYPAIDIQTGYVVAKIPEDFYEYDGLVASAGGSNVIVWGGYTIDGTAQTLVDPMPRFKNKSYLDLNSGHIYSCITDQSGIIGSGRNQHGFSVDPVVSFEEWVLRFLRLKLSVLTVDGWYRNHKKVELSDYAMELPSGTNPTILDTIEFKRLKWITPQPNLMPEVYIKTDGERRFYNAVNYPLTSGTPDPMIGEETSGGQIINPIYYKKDTTTHFDFENEYIQSHPHEHIENFDDVKPTITGQTNTIVVGGVEREIRIDVIEEFAYDELDNDEIWENNDDGNASGEYKHPYFFAKFRPLGFNLFDLALQDDMVLSMTTGHCGACNFKIGVDENTKKNPVQIWKYDVYEGGDYETKVFKYHQGSLRRHVDTANLYYDVSPGDATQYRHVDTVSGIRYGFITQVDRTASFTRRTYSAREVIDGEVGSLRKDNKTHFDGDVVTNGSFIESQQDTSENYVWIALLKDTDTYGEIMPSARPDYGDGNFSVYVRPKSIYDVHTPTSTDSEDEDKADKFVLTNIRLPQVYLRRAERELSKRLVSYMYDNNYQKFNFSIKFSRIFLAQNPTVDENLNENSVLYVSFNNKTYRQYVKHYTYRMTKDTVLPEISVDMNEELSVSRTLAERQAAERSQEAISNRRRVLREIAGVQERISRNTIGRYEDAVLGGNIVNLESRTSLNEMSMTGSQNAENISIAQVELRDTQVELEENNSRFNDFVSVVNTFNTDATEKINQIKNTMEARVVPMITHDEDSTTCTFVTRKFDGQTHLFWYSPDGSPKDIPQICPVESDRDGMSPMEWNDFTIS